MKKFDLENFPVSESAKKMIASVSDGFYDNSYVGKWLYEVTGQEYDTAREIAEDILNQLFPETATWGLMYHEIKWGLPVRENLPYEERRQLIYRKRDYRAPMTPYRMEGYLKTATGFDVRIADINDPGDYGFVAPHPNAFKAYFMGEGILPAKRAKALLNELKQSHTIFSINYRSEYAVDHRALEKFLLKKIIFSYNVPFWKCRTFDGSWDLDGNLFLDACRDYNLILGFRYNMGNMENTEAAKLAFRYASTIRTEGTISNSHICTFGVNFWKLRTLDGRWNLDGKEKLNATRLYNAKMNIKNIFGKFCIDERIVAKFYTAWSQKTEEEITQKITHIYDCDFWQSVYLNGKKQLNGDILLQNSRGNIRMTVLNSFETKRAPESISGEVIIKTRNYWFLNGKRALDGSRNFNSIYRKETI